VLNRVQDSDPWDWRANWYRGMAGLSLGDGRVAQTSFTAVYHAVPGELAPKLGLGLACEAVGDAADAAGWYEIVSRTDPAITAASFGLARCSLRLGDRARAIAAFERVPDSSSSYIDAQTARIRCVSNHDGADPTLADLQSAASALTALPVDSERRERLTVDLLDAALELALSGQVVDDGRTSLLGHRLAERDLRFGLERSYRALARRAGTREERIRLVDQANRTRPLTWT
jgi:serine/threonine-protein kinase PknG